MRKLGAVVYYGSSLLFLFCKNSSVYGFQHHHQQHHNLQATKQSPIRTRFSTHNNERLYHHRRHPTNNYYQRSKSGSYYKFSVVTSHLDPSKFPYRLVTVSSTTSMEEEEEEDSSRGNNNNNNNLVNTIGSYINALRPITVVQAVGALTVGYLSIIASKEMFLSTLSSSTFMLLASMASVFFSYGAGMVMNDCVDASSDALHDKKQDRAIASGRISQTAAMMYVGLLSVTSLSLGYCFVGKQFALWTLSNLILMLGYAAGGWQKVFLVKNILCGWLAISPLIGAVCMTMTTTATSSSSLSSSSSSLGWLALVGFFIHVAREIVKDIEDIDVDRGTKTTLPIVVGEEVAHRIAYGIVGAVCSLMVFSPIYWNIFYTTTAAAAAAAVGSSSLTSRLLFSFSYPISVMVGIPMCIKAYTLRPISKGQKVLKKSIYILLAGMIGGLLGK